MSFEAQVARPLFSRGLWLCLLQIRRTVAANAACEPLLVWLDITGANPLAWHAYRTGSSFSERRHPLSRFAGPST